MTIWWFCKEHNSMIGPLGQDTMAKSAVVVHRVEFNCKAKFEEVVVDP